MITQNYNYRKPEHFEFDKQKALTPATADSSIFQEIQDERNQQGFLQEGKRLVENNMFRILEQKFERTIQEKHQVQHVEKQSKIVYEEYIQECDFKIGVNILKENSEPIKTFLKSIIKSLQTYEDITLIFDKQYQKIKLQQSQEYDLEVFIQTSDNFSKVVWKKQYQIPKNSKKWQVVTISDKNSCSQKIPISLNIQLQKIGAFYMKFLSVKLPITAVDQFYDYKFKLLNKSELLSSIESIMELRGILLQLTQQNMGSRIIQKLLTKANTYQVQQVINQLKPYFLEMILDRYGNYVFQKLFKVANIHQKNLCLEILSKNLINLLKSKQGTHCIQSLIDSMESQEVIAWFANFTVQQIIDLSTNQFSMHFILKILKLDYSYKLHDVILDNFKLLTQNKFGIVVVKGILYQIPKLGYMVVQQINLRNKFLAKCQQSLYEIAFTQFGHYIVEEMLSIYNYQQLENIINYITCYIVFFGKNKYSSSIVKKAIQTYGDYFAVPVINIILQNGLQQLMEISSGEFILHRLLQMTTDQGLKTKLMNQMIVRSPKLNNYQKKHKWMKFFKI